MQKERKRSRRMRMRRVPVVNAGCELSIASTPSMLSTIHKPDMGIASLCSCYMHRIHFASHVFLSIQKWL